MSADRIVVDPYPGETWAPTAAYRWAALVGATTEAPVLQVAWRSDYGRIEWRRVETVVVSRTEYDRGSAP